MLGGARGRGPTDGTASCWRWVYALDVLDALASKTIILGVLDFSTDEVETPETVSDGIRRAFPHAGPERLIAAPDCGVKYLPRDSAYGQARVARRGRPARRAGARRRLSRAV